MNKGLRKVYLYKKDTNGTKLFETFPSISRASIFIASMSRTTLASRLEKGNLEFTNQGNPQEHFILSLLPQSQFEVAWMSKSTEEKKESLWQKIKNRLKI